MLFLNNKFCFTEDLGPLFIVLALIGLELGVAISQAHAQIVFITE
jgi:F-type H+-transporting ATPase subunit a